MRRRDYIFFAKQYYFTHRIGPKKRTCNSHVSPHSFSWRTFNTNTLRGNSKKLLFYHFFVFHPGIEMLSRHNIFLIQKQSICCWAAVVVDSHRKRFPYRTTAGSMADLAFDSCSTRTNSNVPRVISVPYIRFDILSESHSKDPNSAWCHDMEILDCCCRFVVWWWEICLFGTRSLMDSYCSCSIRKS